MASASLNAQTLLDGVVFSHYYSQLAVANAWSGKGQEGTNEPPKEKPADAAFDKSELLKRAACAGGGSSSSTAPSPLATTESLDEDDVSWWIEKGWEGKVDCATINEWWKWFEGDDIASSGNETGAVVCATAARAAEGIGTVGGTASANKGAYVIGADAFAGAAVGGHAECGTASSAAADLISAEADSQNVKTIVDECLMEALGLAKRAAESSLAGASASPAQPRAAAPAQLSSMEAAPPVSQPTGAKPLCGKAVHERSRSGGSGRRTGGRRGRRARVGRSRSRSRLSSSSGPGRLFRRQRKKSAERRSRSRRMIRGGVGFDAKEVSATPRSSAFSDRPQAAARMAAASPCASPCANPVAALAALGCPGTQSVAVQEKMPDWLSDLAPPGSIFGRKVLRMSDSFIKCLIGRGGETIQNIINKTGVDIKIVSSPQDSEGIVSICGNVELGERIVRETLAAKGCHLPVTYGTPSFGNHRQGETERLLIPTELIPTFVGPGGSNIKQIKGKVRGPVSIKVLQELLPGGFQEVQVIGDGWLPAKQMVREKIEEIKRLTPGRWNMPGWDTAGATGSVHPLPLRRGTPGGCGLPAAPARPPVGLSSVGFVL